MKEGNQSLSHDATRHKQPKQLLELAGLGSQPADGRSPRFDRTRPSTTAADTDFNSGSGTSFHTSKRGSWDCLSHFQSGWPEIFIDSVGYGHAPAILKLPHGKHSIQLVSQGFKDWTSELEVRENSIVNVTAKLEK